MTTLEWVMAFIIVWLYAAGVVQAFVALAEVKAKFFLPYKMPSYYRNTLWLPALAWPILTVIGVGFAIEFARKGKGK